MLDGTFQRVIKTDAARAGFDQRVTRHALWRSFATYLLESGSVIRSVQDLLGYAKVETTRINLHCMSKSGLGAPSPLDGCSTGRATKDRGRRTEGGRGSSK